MSISTSDTKLIHELRATPDQLDRQRRQTLHQAARLHVQRNPPMRPSCGGMELSTGASDEIARAIKYAQSEG